MTSPTPQFAIAKAIVPKDEVAVEIRSPVTGKPCGITIYLAGRYTAQMKEAKARLKGAAKDDAETEARLRALLAGATVRWEGVADADGNPLDCTEALARALYDEPTLDWLFEQVLAAYLDRSRFFAHATTPSSPTPTTTSA